MRAFAWHSGVRKTRGAAQARAPGRAIVVVFRFASNQFVFGHVLGARRNFGGSKRIKTKHMESELQR
eukprot:11157887-Lingulodinium_polyedra.AAC.1